MTRTSGALARHSPTQGIHRVASAACVSLHAELQRYVPEIREQDLTFGPSCVRAQSLGADGRMVDDFSISNGPHVLHVRNAPSPAATASLAIGRELAETAIARFGM